MKTNGDDPDPESQNSHKEQTTKILHDAFQAGRNIETGGTSNTNRNAEPEFGMPNKDTYVTIDGKQYIIYGWVPSENDPTV